MRICCSELGFLWRLLVAGVLIIIGGTLNLTGVDMLIDPDDEKMPSNEVSLTQLRKNIYQMVDQVIETGKPLTINRQGSLLRLAVVSKAPTKLGNLKKRNTIVNEGDEFENNNSYWST